MCGRDRMALTWYRLRCWLSSALLVAAGCHNTQADLRPPKQREVLRLPPETEARFDKPPAFPENTLNQAPSKSKVAIADPTNPNAGGTPQRFNMGSPGGGMGGMGGMGGGMGGMGT